jgi:hypothetical protein
MQRMSDGTWVRSWEGQDKEMKTDFLCSASASNCYNGRHERGDNCEIPASRSGVLLLLVVVSLSLLPLE